MSYFVEICLDRPLEVGEVSGFIPSDKGEDGGMFWYRFDTPNLTTARSLKTQVEDLYPDMVRIFKVEVKTVEEHVLVEEEDTSV